MRTVVTATLALMLLPSGCFRGDQREKQPPPGLPGGKCLAPDGHCSEGQCNRNPQAEYCFDPLDPCAGFFCGGSDRGMCLVTTEGLPSCTCAAGFDNQEYDLYCCPDPGFGLDPLCTPQDSSTQGAEAGGSSSGEGGGSDGAGGSSGTGTGP